MEEAKRSEMGLPLQTVVVVTYAQDQVQQLPDSSVAHSTMMAVRQVQADRSKAGVVRGPG